jgi:SAM-dependent methyltransferase
MSDEDLRKLAAMYSGHARGYADAWSPVIRPLGQRLLASLPWDGARRVLDLGTGTGSLLPDIRSAAPAGAAVVGIDPSPGMLELARRHGAPLALMDALRLGIRSDSIDVVVMAFVLFHMAAPDAALAEIRRVLRRGGSVGTVTWAEDPDLEATQVFEAELDAYGAWDPAPVPASDHSRTDTPEKLTALFAGAGLEPLRVWIERFEYRWELERFIALRTTFGRTMRKLDSLEPRRREAFLVAARARLARLDPFAFFFRAAVVCDVARRPR